MNYSLEYANKVVSGEIVAGKKIIQACKRTIRDFNRKRGFPYYFDEDKADKAIQFIEAMPAKDGSVLKLELFQKYIVSELFGWRMNGTGNRRFDRAYLSLSRKNGKSFLVSCIGALYLLMENKPARGRQIVFSANSSAQAHIGFDMLANGLRQLATTHPAINSRLKINRNEIVDRKTDSVAMPLASDLHSLDGLQSDLAICDEFALARTDDILNTLKSGQVASDNSLLAIISTASPDLNSPMYKEFKFVSKVLSGTEKADRYFICCYQQDSNEEAFDPDTWEKSNPLLANPELAKVMRSSIQADVDLLSKQGKMRLMLVKNFNRFQNARADGYLMMNDWDAQAIDPPDTTGKPVFIGIDLSKSSDLTAISWAVPMDGYLYVDSHSFVATKYGGIDEKSREDGFDYVAAEGRGEADISKLDSGLIDYSAVLKYILNLIEVNKWDVKAIAYDPWRSAYLVTDLEKRDFNLISVRQGRQTLSTPTIRFRDDLYSGKIKHSDNQLLAYAAGNAILKYDANGNMLIDKQRNATKIDPLAALMNAYTIELNEEEDKSNEVDNDYYISGRWLL
ncbi:terminase large subunit [Lacticaseibacillus pabuli]|uniref:Terminase large subunit n=1 Tax=Lacticaseibacillus pabuli TaxID=3025672 RepID=A0ABY7WPG4_9LACO|nr:terminase TerL endonuclease subunit [Lacticaseibacillus sp. KACC 23028]WDF82064.1 terminase large subunit [Lacticaseibacillus sp. KACC 23028]